MADNKRPTARGSLGGRQTTNRTANVRYERSTSHQRDSQDDDEPSSLPPPMRHLVVHNKKSPYDVYIGRPSKWGNPFVIGKHGDRKTVIQKYEEWLSSKPELIEEAKRELRGKVLGCWCAPKACHGDVLARIANS